MRVLCLYNVNLDAVHTIDGDRLSQLILEEGFRAGPDMPDMPETIGSAEDFLSALLACMDRGIGAELMVECRNAAEFIERSFDWSCRMGGNAGNMANVLGRLGAEVVLNVPSLTPEQASFFHSGVSVPFVKNGDATLVLPAEAAEEGEGLTHFVLQFEEGTRVETAGGAITSPRENRFIATFDPLNTRLFLDPDFDTYCKHHLDDLDGILVSGFHLAPFQSPEGRGYRDVLEEEIEMINRWKRSRPALYVHVELGDFQDAEIMRYLIGNLKVDSLGMNEDELGTIEDIDQGWRGLLEATARLWSRLEVGRVCVHTREFSISISDGHIRPEDEIDALTYGADVAAALVATGEVMKRPKIEGLKVSATGSAAAEDLSEKGTRWGRGAYAICDDQTICLVPSLICEKPKVTVGIGDAMTAAAYYRGVEAMIGYEGSRSTIGSS
ncbi:MAG: hypothetical protein D4Q77_03515 [Methanothrix sp.]|nr:MAG: hypothetical protein D4Q77_03515 [Methanothrix sp.]